MRLFLFIVSVGVIALLPCVEARAITLDEIVRRTLEAEKQNAKKLDGWRYRQDITVEKIDKGDTVKNTEKLTVWATCSTNITYQVSNDGVGSGTFVAGKMRQPTASEQKTVKTANIFKESFQLSDLAPRFLLERQPDESVRVGKEKFDSRCYVISFQPKPGVPTPASRKEKVINALQGKLWILQDSFTIAQMKSSLHHPVSLAWFMVTMKDLNLAFQSQRLPNQLLAPASINMSYTVRAGFSNIRQRQQIGMSQFSAP